MIIVCTPIVLLLLLVFGYLVPAYWGDRFRYGGDNESLHAAHKRSVLSQLLRLAELSRNVCVAQIAAQVLEAFPLHPLPHLCALARSAWISACATLLQIPT